MGDWLHCNNCFLQPGESGTQFYLTNCRHIFCHKCLEKGACKEKCSVCENTCSYIPLSGKMRPETDMYFKNPFDLISDSTKKSLQVLAFQGGHRARYVTYLKNEIKKMKSEMDNVREAFNKFKTLERDLMQEKQEYMGLKDELHKARKELAHSREEIAYLKSIISEKGISLSSPGSMARSQRASPVGRSQVITRSQVPRGPSPVFTYSQALNMRSESPMNTDTSTSGSQAKSPGFRSHDILQFYHQNMSPADKLRTPESRCQRVPSSTLSTYSQQGHSNTSHHSGFSQSAKLPESMITSGRLQVRTPPSGGKIGRIGTTPPTNVPATPKSALQLLPLPGHTPLRSITPKLISITGHAPGSAPQLASLVGQTPRLMNLKKSES